jgi:hypothetical protein
LIVSSTNLLECCSLPKMFLNPLVDQALGLLLLELLIVCPNIVLVLVTCIVLLSYRWLKYKNEIVSNIECSLSHFLGAASMKNMRLHVTYFRLQKAQTINN